MPEGKQPVPSLQPERARPVEAVAVTAMPPPIKAHLEDARQTWVYLPSRSPAMRKVEHRALRLAPTEESILILGETGSGKDLMARLIHENSPRRGKPFVHVNCAALSETLLESELFGHVRGAYTGATDSQHGLFEAANGGTIFLDEIGELPPKLQAKLLHVLQERRLLRVGGRDSIRVDVRVLAATNRDLKEAMKTGGFRRDLFYRLGVVSLHIPALRDRMEDLEPLAECLFARYARLYNRPDLTGLGSGMLEELQSWSWPGNIRELENAIKRLILLGDTEHSLRQDDAGPHVGPGAPVVAAATVPADQETMPLQEVRQRALDIAERGAILKALNRRGWNRKRAARDLKISYRSLLYKIKDHTLTRDSPVTRDDH